MTAWSASQLLARVTGVQQVLSTDEVCRTLTAALETWYGRDPSVVASPELVFQAVHAFERACSLDERPSTPDAPVDVDEPVEEIFSWSDRKLQLPSRLRTIWASNPLEERFQRRKITQVLPFIQDLPPAAPFPAVSGRAPYLDGIYQNWSNRCRDVLRCLTLLHWKLDGQYDELNLPADLQAVDLLEQTFALTTSLEKVVEHQRKTLVDRRFRTSESENSALITNEDLKFLDRVDKMKRTLHTGKGKGSVQGKSRYHPYGTYGSYKSSKGGYGKGKSGRGGKSRPFSFLQVVNAKKEDK